MTTSVYKRIADELRQQIENGTLPAGGDVPTEGELARRWGTSRGPIRNALAELRTEGLIETTRGRPSRVAERRVVQPVDVSIPFTRWARQAGGEPGAQTQHISRSRANAKQARLLEIAEGDPVVDILRLRLLDGRPAMLERLCFIDDVGRILFDADLDNVSITEYLHDNGHGYDDIDHEIDAVAADDDDARLLRVDPGWPVLRLRRFTRDPNGRLFEASDDRYRSDVVRFTVAAAGRSRRRSSRGTHFLRRVGA